MQQNTSNPKVIYIKDYDKGNGNGFYGVSTSI